MIDCEALMFRKWLLTESFPHFEAKDWPMATDYYVEYPETKGWFMAWIRAQVDAFVEVARETRNTRQGGSPVEFRRLYILMHERPTIFHVAADVVNDPGQVLSRMAVLPRPNYIPRPLRAQYTTIYEMLMGIARRLLQEHAKPSPLGPLVVECLKSGGNPEPFRRFFMALPEKYNGLRITVFNALDGGQRLPEDISDKYLEGDPKVFYDPRGPLITDDARGISYNYVNGYWFAQRTDERFHTRRRSIRPTDASDIAQSYGVEGWIHIAVGLAWAWRLFPAYDADFSHWD